MKINSSRLRKANWNLTLPLPEARKNDEVISLSDSQTLTFIDEINNIKNADIIAKKIKNKIKTIRKQSNSFQNRKEIKQLYNELDTIQFKADYACIIIDRKSDYLRACRGFTINGVRYVRLLGTNGGVKNSTIVFVSDRVAPTLKTKINNGRNEEMPLVPAKFEAYQALTCSGSTPVSFPNGVLVVNDCETKFKADVINITDEADGEPLVEAEQNADVDLTESDGYGMMSPALAERWSNELGLDYLASGMNTRFAWEKGMVFCFDFVDFAKNVAGTTMVKDAWGNEVDITKVELVLTTSMVKLWDSYESCDHYLSCCKENGYTFRIAKTCPKELESERDLNYQFIQSYNLSDEDIEKLIEPTVSEINDIISGDYKKTILFLKGMYMNSENVASIKNDFAKAIMIDESMMNDPFVRKKIYQMIKKRIDDAKVGVLRVHGNYSIVCGDPYSLCQSMFGMEVTGLLKAGEIYNKYWADYGSDKLACFRAPMTCHNNIRLMRVSNDDKIKYWYRFMTACTIFNSWDTAAHALNGMDKDGDLVLLTDNEVLVNNLIELPALMCVQRRAAKKVITEDDLIQANINSFGDEIGKTTNRITSMFEVQSKFPKGSKEYDALDYRIKCGQLYQQNSIDKAKGIIAKPMPKEWYDRNAVRDMDVSTPESRELHSLYLNILADKKPYFMIYIYPTLMKQYNTYIKNTNKKCIREFRTTIADLLEKENRTPDEEAFVKYYLHRMPVGISDCVMNKICRKIESAFDGFLRLHSNDVDFDYTMLKYDEEYCSAQYNAILTLYEEYIKRTQDYMQYVMKERIDEDESSSQRGLMIQDFKRECDIACPDRKQLCNIILDICYQRNCSKQFAWDICNDEIIDNLLVKNGYVIHYPVMDDEGDIRYGGKSFSLCSQKIGGDVQ